MFVYELSGFGFEYSCSHLKDIVFVLFQFLICLNCFELLLVLILGIWLIICLELTVNPVPSFFLFQGFNFTLSAIVSSGSNFIFSSPSSRGMSHKSLSSGSSFTSSSTSSGEMSDKSLHLLFVFLISLFFVSSVPGTILLNSIYL